MERHFLQNYDIHRKPEATESAQKKERLTGEEGLVRDYDERITAYIERLEKIFLNPDHRKRERNIEMLKPAILDAFVIKKENFPESYFEYQKKLMRERGIADVDFTEEIKDQEIQSVVDVQRKSLESWIDYLTSDENKGSPDVKYFAMQGILKLGKFDTEKYAFAKRDNKTTAPFPEIDREALAIVMGAVECVHKKGEDRGYSEKLKQLVKENKSFGELYAYAMQELDLTQEKDKLLPITEGEWVEFSQGDDPNSVVNALEGKRSNLCIRDYGFAERYLNTGPLYIYFSKDKNGKATIPRIAVSVQNGVTWEVRGTYNKNEDVDPFIAETTILQDKLRSLPKGEKFAKKDADMRKVTAIEKKTKIGEHLNKDELVFIYEIDSTIEGFGYQKDPRIEEIRKQRIPGEDMQIIFECNKEQIALNIDQINENTVAYLGPWNPNIFQTIKKFPNIKHLYESFPDKKIFMETIETDPSVNSKESAKKKLEEKGIYVSSYADDLLAKTEFSQNKEKYKLVRFSVEQLGFPQGATTDQIYRRAEELGLELCPAEVGPHLRLQTDSKDYMLIAMEQIIGRGGDPDVFDLDWSGAGLALCADGAEPDYWWGAGSGFVFLSRKN